MSSIHVAWMRTRAYVYMRDEHACMRGHTAQSARARERGWTDERTRYMHILVPPHTHTCTDNGMRAHYRNNMNVHARARIHTRTHTGMRTCTCVHETAT